MEVGKVSFTFLPLFYLLLLALLLSFLPLSFLLFPPLPLSLLSFFPPLSPLPLFLSLSFLFSLPPSPPSPEEKYHTKSITSSPPSPSLLFVASSPSPLFSPFLLPSLTSPSAPPPPPFFLLLPLLFLPSPSSPPLPLPPLPPPPLPPPPPAFFSPSPSSLPPLPHQSLLLECGCGSIKHEHRFDVIVEELTNPVEEYQEVGVGEGIPLCIPRPLHCQVQPDTHIWCVCV